MKIIHAHLKYIWNKSTKNLKEILKALGEVDFTKYALPTIIVYKQWSKNGYVKNAVNLSEINFQYYNSSCTSSICVEHVCKVLKRNTESPCRS